MSSPENFLPWYPRSCVWLVCGLLQWCTRSTTHHGRLWELLKMSANIIQGSGVGPAAYVITAEDLQTPGNRLFKYADDTYLIIPLANSNTRSVQLTNIDTWAQANNMTLNRSKYVEIVLQTISDGSRSINLHNYLTLSASHPLRSWEWRSLTVCQSVAMFRTSSCRVHRWYMCCEHCTLMA